MIPIRTTHLPPKILVLASENPVKIRAARRGFERAFPGESFVVEPVTVPSGVASQPFSDAETLRGAENRVARATEIRPDGDFWIGMEGGLMDEGESLVAFAWVVVRSASLAGRSRTATFALPERVAELVRSGHELGEADDVVFGRSGSKRKGGAVGLLTGNVIDRAELYEPSVVLSLIPFLNPELYP
jgi:inosine/xanthosine triphosphatase